MITVSTPYKGQMVPTFVFEDDDPLLAKCVTDLTLAGIPCDVSVSDPSATL